MGKETKVWMLRVSSEVVGPFTTDEVSALIANGQVSEVDEISPSGGRWFFLRDRNEFLVLLEEQKVKHQSQFQRNTNSVTETMTVNLNEEERTKEVTLLEEDSKTSPNFDFNDFKLDPKSLKRKKVENQVTKKQNAKNIEFFNFKFLVLLVALVLSCVFYFTSPNLTKTFKTLFLQETSETFVFSYRSGQLKEAYEALKLNSKLKDRRPLEYVSLSLAVDQNIRQAEKWLSRIQNKNSRVWKNLEGLKFFYANQLKKAEASFLSAAELKGRGVAPLINLGLLYRKKQDWKQAKVFFESAYARKETNSYDEVGFYLAEVWARLYVKERNFSGLKDVNKFILTELASQSVYAIEFDLLQRWMRRFDPDLKGFESQRLRHLDPEILFSRKTSPKLYAKLEGSLEVFCNDLKKMRDYYVNLMCRISNKNKIQFEFQDQQILSKAQSADDLALVSFVYQKIKKPVLAEQFLSDSFKKKSKGSLKYTVQARFCFQNGKFKCAAENWRKALDISRTKYTSYSGLAWSFYKVADFKNAQSFLNRGLQLTSSYSDLHHLALLLKQREK